MLLYSSLFLTYLTLNQPFFFYFKDEQSLNFLKGKFPQSPVMFVCNKVDITKEAGEFDNSDDDGDDDDEVKGRHGREEIVFDQLKERKFISEESWQTCDLFHAFSVNNVRKERLMRIEGAATWRFQRFETHLRSLLGKVMETQTSRETSIQVDDETDTQTLIPFWQLEDEEKELQESPAVFFIGERNCGKSSIINELLRQSSLPVHENSCTKRIVRIKSKCPQNSNIVR